MIPLIGMKLHTPKKKRKVQALMYLVLKSPTPNHGEINSLSVPQKVSNLLLAVIIFWLTMQCHLVCRWEEYYTSRALFTPTHPDINLRGKKWTDVHFACARRRKNQCIIVLIHQLNLEDMQAAYGARRPMASTGIDGGNMSHSKQFLLQVVNRLSADCFSAFVFTWCSWVFFFSSLALALSTSKGKSLEAESVGNGARI